MFKHLTVLFFITIILKRTFVCPKKYLTISYSIALKYRFAINLFITMLVCTIFIFKLVCMCFICSFYCSYDNLMLPMTIFKWWLYFSSKEYKNKCLYFYIPLTFRFDELTSICFYSRNNLIYVRAIMLFLRKIYFKEIWKIMRSWTRKAARVVKISLKNIVCFNENNTVFNRVESVLERKLIISNRYL